MKPQWNAQEVFHKWLKNAVSESVNTNHHQKNASLFKLYKEDEIIPLHKLEELLVMAARIVDELGQKYLPVFDRFEREIEKRRIDERQLSKIASLLETTESTRLNGDFVKPSLLLCKAWTIAISRS